MRIVKRTGSKIDWLKWRTEVPRVFGITPAAPETLPVDALLTTRCSVTKKGGQSEAVPKDFYVSPLNLRFYRVCEQLGRRYGILSDLYGIHFDDEELPFYDIHPSELTDDRLIELGTMIGTKCRQRRIERLAFYNTSPIMSKPYFCMLAASGLETYFLTQLPRFDGVVAQGFFS